MMNEESSAIDVLMVIEGEIATTHLLEQVLAACAAGGIRYRKRLLRELTVDDFAPATVPLFVRSCDPLVHQWVDALLAARRPYLFYIDDNFWKLQGDSELALYYQHPMVRRSLDHVVRHALFVMTNTEELADFIRPRNAAIVQLPTFFDFDVIAGAVAEPTDEIRIGFAGSTSRVPDLEIIKPVIQPILDAYPDVVFEFAGVQPAGVETGDRIRFFDYQSDYVAYIRFQVLRGWLIGLAPLVDNESNRCKTDVKYREYGACGIVGVYSDLLPYRRAVRDGVTGIIAENTPAAWLQALTGLLDDIAATRRLGNNAVADVRERYCVDKVALIWSDFFIRADRELRQRGTRPVAIVVVEPSLRTRLSMLRLLVAISYREGGLTLIARRVSRRVARYLGIAARTP